jgi:cytochrome c peroxidase
MRFLLTALVPILWPLLASSDTLLAPGYGELGYELPPPGSYELPSLGEAADGEVLDTDGSARSLRALFDDRVVILSFVYRSCDDVNGCPLATAVLHRIRQETARHPRLAGALRLITLSFDPVRDTPEQMAKLAERFHFTEGGAEWLFLTTASREQLRPILAAYDQAVVRERGAEGKETGTLAHILRVFLIDRQGDIRNIYSPSFLHPDLLLNDAQTVLMEQPAGPMRAQLVSPVAGPGDNREDYGRGDYRTRSLSLAARQGREMDLVANCEKPPLGLPPVPVPASNPVTAGKVALGRKLFFDRRLSLNGTVSCAMCHIPEQGYTSNELRTAVGIEGRTVRRNTPSLYNAGYARLLFHDGRETELRHQVWGPLLAANEMGNPSIASVIEKLRRLPDYQGLFEDAFGRGPDMETVGMALANYQRTLNSADSPFDRWRYGGDSKAMDKAGQRGFDLFTGKAGCSACHHVGPGHALFTDHGLHNTGVGFRASMAREPLEQEVQVAPGITLDVASDLIQSVAEPSPNDLGRYEITQDPDDRWKYKTPGLRNVALTAPYMHDGTLATLEEVIAFYDRGGVPNPLLDPLVRPLNLSEQDKADLVAFLRALTGSNIEALVADAFAAPIEDIKADDPKWWE